MFKAKHSQLPHGLQILFIVNPRNSRREHDFKSIFARTTLKQQCISVTGVKLWNSQNKYLKSCTSMFVFKQAYKKKLLDNYKK